MNPKLTYPLSWGTRTFVMGILNVTPDSFSGDGLIQQTDVVKAALAQAKLFVQAGADILDIGGESTRPGSTPVNAQEEMLRVLPVIKAIRDAGVDVILSIDTYKAEVAHEALEAGVDWVNDVWALRADPDMAAVVSRHKAPVILMHNRSKPNNAFLDKHLGGIHLGAKYENLIEDIKSELLASVNMAHQAGIRSDHIILDSGIGFGKSIEDNLELLNRQNELCVLGYPLLLGPSRKSFIGYTLNVEPQKRLEGTAAAIAIGIARGVDIIRVHDVEVMVKIAHMADAIVRRQNPGR